MPTEDERASNPTAEEKSFEEHGFDELARGLDSGTITRCQMLRLLAGVVVGGALGAGAGMTWPRTASAGPLDQALREIGRAARSYLSPVYRNSAPFQVTSPLDSLAVEGIEGRRAFELMDTSTLDALRNANVLTSRNEIPSDVPTTLRTQIWQNPEYVDGPEVKGTSDRIIDILKGIQWAGNWKTPETLLQDENWYQRVPKQHDFFNESFFESISDNAATNPDSWLTLSGQFWELYNDVRGAKLLPLGQPDPETEKQVRRALVRALCYEMDWHARLAATDEEAKQDSERGENILDFHDVAHRMVALLTDGLRLVPHNFAQSGVLKFLRHWNQGGKLAAISPWEAAAYVVACRPK